MMKRTLVAVVMVLALASCGTSTGGKVSDKSPSGSNAPSTTAASKETSTTSSTATEPATTTTTAPANPKFGATFKYDDGLSVTIGAPAPFKPSEYAAADPAAAYLAFDVKIVNGTKTNFDPSTFSTSLQSGNAEGAEIFDSDGGIDSAPSTPILPGRESVFKIAYGVSNPADLVLEVSPDFGEHANVIFTT